jgi:hypothetical protein
LGKYTWLYCECWNVEELRVLSNLTNNLTSNWCTKKCTWLCHKYWNVAELRVLSNLTNNLSFKQRYQGYAHGFVLHVGMLKTQGLIWFNQQPDNHLKLECTWIHYKYKDLTRPKACQSNLHLFNPIICLPRNSSNTHGFIINYYNQIQINNWQGHIILKHCT